MSVPLQNPFQGTRFILGALSDAVVLEDGSGLDEVVGLAGSAAQIPQDSL
ncbi:hypothetical protein [Planomonospora sp. ID82291]|nr:hypothetical protein [Planomonospora sp. ID82291]MBG0815707.1 hypothetical protein [Planomonospora sp. ID82291]